MASTETPYGLRPVNMLGGQVMTHSIRLMRIASGYATSIFYGDLVQRVADGTIEKSTITTTSAMPNTPVGVFLGVEYEDSSGLRNRQFYPASLTVDANTIIWAYVCDDPDALFEVQADGTLDLTAMGANAALVQGAGSTTTGNSGVQLDASSVATTAALPLRIVDYVDKQGFSELGDAFTDVIVKLNAHFYRQTTGI